MRIALAAAATLWVLSAATRAAPDAPISVRELFSNPPVSAPRLSGDGKTYAFVRSEGDNQIILSVGVEKGSRPVLLARVTDPRMRLAWVEWANADRLLISGQALNPYHVGMRSRMTQLFGINRDGTGFGWLGKRWPVFGQLKVPVLYQDQVIHWTPDDPGGVLLDYHEPPDHGSKVVRMDVVTGATHVVQSLHEQIRSWYADPAGHVRAGDETTTSNVYRLYARIQPEDPLKVVIEHAIFGAAGPTFAGFHADPAKIYVKSLHEGRDAIFEFDLRTKQLGALVFAHPLVDVDGLQLDPGPEGRVVGVHYIVDRPEIRFFDEAAERENEALGRAFQREFDTPVFHELISVSDDGNRQIFAVSSEVQPPVYYLYDRSAHALAHILDQRPRLGPGKLASTERMTYQARDGLAIPAYLTPIRQ